MLGYLNNKNREKGFTLVELIVVMAILAILASIAVPKFTGVLSGARDNANEANKILIENAAELYYYQTGTDVKNINELVSSGYLKVNPPNPFTGAKDAYGVVTDKGVAKVTAPEKNK